VVASCQMAVAVVAADIVVECVVVASNAGPAVVAVAADIRSFHTVAVVAAAANTAVAAAADHHHIAVVEAGIAVADMVVVHIVLAWVVSEQHSQSGMAVGLVVVVVVGIVEYGIVEAVEVGGTVIHHTHHLFDQSEVEASELVAAAVASAQILVGSSVSVAAHLAAWAWARHRHTA